MKQIFSEAFEGFLFDVRDSVFLALERGDEEYRRRLEQKINLQESMSNCYKTPDLSKEELICRVNEYFKLEISTSLTEHTALYFSGFMDAIILQTKLNMG